MSNNGNGNGNNNGNGNKPLIKFSDGLITFTIWENSSERDGETNTFHSTSVERRYKDNDGNWKSTTSFNTRDLPTVAALALQAHAFITAR